MRRFFRNILKNVSFAFRQHFATADNIHVIFCFYIQINVKDEIEVQGKVKEWTLTNSIRLNFSKVVVPFPKIMHKTLRWNENFAWMYHIYTNNFALILLYICIYIYYIYIYTHTHIHIYTHIYTYIYIYNIYNITYIYTYIYNI